MPPKREYILYAPLVPKQKELYDAAIKGKLAQVIEKNINPHFEDKNDVDKENSTESLRKRAFSVNYTEASSEDEHLSDDAFEQKIIDETMTIKENKKQYSRYISIIHV